MSTEALKLALCTLERVKIEFSIHQMDTAIAVLQEALAQPQQEPVAEDNSNYRLDPPGLDPRYTSPPARKPLTDEKIRAIVREVDEEEGHIIHFARAIEAAHGIKENT